jgi:hypothetical protein
MSTATIEALSTGIPAVIAAVTALVYAVKGKRAAAIAMGTALHANMAVNAHITQTHDAFPIQPPEVTKP